MAKITDGAKKYLESAQGNAKPLRGSEKQVAWAWKIREAMVPEIFRVGDVCENQWRRDEMSREQYKAAITRGAAMLLTSGAAWWINHRHMAVDYLMVEATNGELK